jgi:hypothetical protein
MLGFVISRRLLQQAGAAQGGGGSTPIQPTALQYLSPSQNGVDFNWYATYVSGLVNPTSQATAASAISSLQITAAYDFYWVATTFKADIAGSSSVGGVWPDYTESNALVPRVLISITDTGSGRVLTPTPVPIDSLAGPGERPYRLIVPRQLRATTVFQFTWTPYGSPSTAITYNYIYLVLHGFVVQAGAPYPL